MTTTEPNVEAESDTVTLTIDGKEVIAKKGELLITAAQRAGVFIPRFCYHDRLKPVGMCRMCLVEIEGVRGLPPACTTPVADGMEVRFQKDNVEKAGEGVLELLLINHPLDCPVCDRGGECPLQDQTLSNGPGETRFVEEKRHWEKPIEISDHVLLDRERCIQCSRCTRFADDVAGDPLITFAERGGKTEVATFPGDPFASYFSGNIVQICPVGALTAKPYRFNSRPWDLESSETTCQGCSVGCKGTAQTSRNEMVRFLGVDSEPVNQGWLCDKGRYGFDFAQSENRVRSPFIKSGDDRVMTNINDALDAAALALSAAKEKYGADSVAFLGGARGTNEDAYSLARLAKGVIGTRHVDAQIGNSLPADVVLTAKRARISDLDSAAAIVTIGCDLKESLPLIYLRARKAVAEKGVALIDVSVAPTSMSAIATTQISAAPGDEFSSLKEIVAALPEGPVVVVAGDINIAQDRSSFRALVSTLLENDNVSLLPAVGPSNIIGAYEMGLTPGLFPGRVDAEHDDVSSFGTWPTVPGSHETSTADIIERAIAGEIKVLVLSGANIVDHFPDYARALKALETVETVIAIDSFINATTEHADIFFPTSVANEKEGTVTNIEGRVQRVVQVVAPQGNVLDDWKISSLLAQRLGYAAPEETAEDITNEIARIATSFAHLTTGVLLRARDGAIVPIDDNKDSLVQSVSSLVETPSWEPIASRAHSDEDPGEELYREEHHPSANVVFAPMITKAFERNVHNHHLDQYSLRIVFADTFYRPSTMNENSEALSGVVNAHTTDVVRINPKDIEHIALREDNLINLTNDHGTISVRAVADKSVMRGVIVASYHAEHPLRDLVSLDDSVTDVRVEANS